MWNVKTIVFTIERRKLWKHSHTKNKKFVKREQQIQPCNRRGGHPFQHLGSAEFDCETITWHQRSQLIQQMENYPQRQALQSDPQQHRAFNPFSKESKDAIKQLETLNYGRCEVEPKSQCRACLTHWSAGIVYCTCGHFLRDDTTENMKCISSVLDLFSIPNFTYRRAGHTVTGTGRKVVENTKLPETKKNFNDHFGNNQPWPRGVKENVSKHRKSRSNGHPKVCFTTNTPSTPSQPMWTATTNFHLFLQYGLRDLMVSSFPCAFLWIH